MLSWCEETTTENHGFQSPYSSSSQTLELEGSTQASGDSLDDTDGSSGQIPPSRHGSLLQQVGCLPKDSTCCCCCCCNEFDKLDDFSDVGRSSPDHDLGYHTLISRQTPIPVHQPNNNASLWPSSLRIYSPVASETPQLRNVSLKTDQLLATYKGKSITSKGSFFDKLSDDVILKIFSGLSPHQLCACAQVCRRWYFLVWEPQLWTTIKLNGPHIYVDRALRMLTRLLCRDSPSRCLMVEKVILNGCLRLTDRGLNVLARRCPELRSLQLKGCSNITNIGVLELVTNCCNLEYLDLTGCSEVDCIYVQNNTRSSLSFINGFLPSPTTHQLQIKYLDLTDCHSLSDNNLKIIVRTCPQLQSLYLRRCLNLTDVGLKHIANYCLVLKEFSISDCFRITDFGLYELAKLGSNLRYLSVAKCGQISDAGIKHIARHCYKLRYLNVRGCEAVSDDSMELLAFSCPRLRALDIGKCDVTDYGLKVLSENCPNLKKLSIKSCDMVTDKGIQSIAYYCRGLQQMNLQDCQVTVDGYKTVKKFCKRCIIEHTNPGFY
uniref:F-box domain-containing protein n=1 Tax=Strigamia maritima TaxID=126957 RepID=T1JF58_STRMM